MRLLQAHVEPQGVVSAPACVVGQGKPKGNLSKVGRDRRPCKGKSASSRVVAWGRAVAWQALQIRGCVTSLCCAHQQPAVRRPQRGTPEARGKRRGNRESRGEESSRLRGETDLPSEGRSLPSLLKSLFEHLHGGVILPNLKHSLADEHRLPFLRLFPLQSLSFLCSSTGRDQSCQRRTASRTAHDFR